VSSTENIWLWKY